MQHPSRRQAPGSKPASSKPWPHAGTDPGFLDSSFKFTKGGSIYLFNMMRFSVNFS